VQEIDTALRSGAGHRDIEQLHVLAICQLEDCLEALFRKFNRLFIRNDLIVLAYDCEGIFAFNIDDR
jgi:hypothetical protein